MALRLRRIHLRAKNKKSPKAKRITKKRKAKKNGTAKKTEANGNKRKIFAQKQAKTTKERGISHTKGKRKAASSSNGDSQARDTIAIEIEEPTSTSRLETKGDRGNGRGIGMENSHPPIRKVARLLPLHDNTLSRISTLVSLTSLHEKPEKEEKRIVRDDRKWMKEVAYREHLLRKNEPPTSIATKL
ncbi:unnamed protein product, partial [Mesorhabditis belari]|uniref:Uncharacterized protein n=1 Tax=Mesorhabditis belari TaxID=2138241 RepID=A0AAF3J9R4_9BILA